MHLLANLIGTNALALKQKDINPQGPRYIRLVGRKSGLIDWLLNICGIDTTTTLEVYDDRIEYKHSSLSGTMQKIIPLSKVSNLVCGYFKPVILLVIAVISLVIAVILLLTSSINEFSWILMIGAIVSFFYYFMKKSTLISIIPDSSIPTCVAFKRSLIENKNITENEAKKIIEIIVSLVEKANSKDKINITDSLFEKNSPKENTKNSTLHKKSPDASIAATEKSNDNTADPAKKEVFIKAECPHCNQRYEVDAKYIDEIIKCQNCGQDFVIEPLS